MSFLILWSESRSRWAMPGASADEFLSIIVDVANGKEYGR